MQFYNIARIYAITKYAARFRLHQVEIRAQAGATLDLGTFTERVESFGRPRPSDSFYLVGGQGLPLVVAAAAEPNAEIEEPSSNRSMVRVLVPWLMKTSARNTLPKPGI